MRLGVPGTTLPAAQVAEGVEGMLGEEGAPSPPQEAKASASPARKPRQEAGRGDEAFKDAVETSTPALLPLPKNPAQELQQLRPRQLLPQASGVVVKTVIREGHEQLTRRLKAFSREGSGEQLHVMG